MDLSVVREGGRAELAVSDSGIGLSPEHLPHVFDRFYRAGPARSSGGSGLGLSICEWVAEAHGGSIRVRSGTRPGTVVVVSLPAHSASAPEAPD